MCGDGIINYHGRLSAKELREVDRLEAIIAQLPPRDPESEQSAPRETAAAETQLDELLWRYADDVTEAEITEQLRLMETEKA